MSRLLPHQKDALLRIHELDGRAGIFVGLGGGKTRIALANSMLRKHERILVALPGYVAPVWRLEAEKLGFPHPVYDLTSGSVASRTRTLKEMTGPGLVTINYEAYWREPMRSVILKTWRPDAVILDEAHRIRNRTARQSRFAHALQKNDYVDSCLALTGTPATNGLQDLWSIAQFINPNVFGPWRHFAAKYIIPGWFPGQIAGYQNEADARERLASMSFQWDGEQPIAEDIIFPVILDPGTRKKYEELKKESIVTVQSLEGGDHVALGRIVLTVILRLLQMTSGFITDVDENKVQVSREKANATCDLIEDLHDQKKQVVVFCRFLNDLDVISQSLPAGIRYGIIRGGVSQPERAKLVASFDKGELDVLICQTKSASLGIDLSAAQAAIFHSVDYSLDDFMQAKGRLTGTLRQRHPVVFYHMVAAGTINETIYQALGSKTDVARKLTDLSYALALIS